MAARKAIWEMSDDDLQAVGQRAVQKAITKAHTAGIPTVHMDAEGCLYKRFPDGTKEIIADTDSEQYG